MKTRNVSPGFDSPIENVNIYTKKKTKITGGNWYFLGHTHTISVQYMAFELSWTYEWYPCYFFVWWLSWQVTALMTRKVLPACKPTMKTYKRGGKWKVVTGNYFSFLSYLIVILCQAIITKVDVLHQKVVGCTQPPPREKPPPEYQKG